MLIMRIQRALELSDVVEIHVLFQDKLATKYTLSLSEPLFNTLAEHLCFDKAGLRLPIRDTRDGKLVPRHWKLELRLEGSLDKELLDKIQLADPEIKVLSPESGPQRAEQSIGVGTDVGESASVSVGEPKAGGDRRTDVLTPTTGSEESAVDIKILREPKEEKMKQTDAQGESDRDDMASKNKRPSPSRIFKPSVPRVAIKVARDALEIAKTHAATSHNEVGGVLVGKHNEPKDGDSKYSVEIWDAIPGKNLVSRGASVTFTADTWSTAIQQVEEKHGEDLYIIGWYHTHPGFGIFMSGYDRFIHENYFNEPWQVALVIDPYADKEGFFAWHINDEKEQTLEKYPKEQTEFLEGKWQPPVQAPEKLTESKKPTKEEAQETEEQESKDTPEAPGREPVAPNTQKAENHALPSGDASGQVVEGRSTQESGVRREHAVQQTEKPPDEKSDQVSAPVSKGSTTLSANNLGTETVSLEPHKKVDVVVLVISSLEMVKMVIGRFFFRRN